MSKNPYTDIYYGCVFETPMLGTLALQLALEYPFHESGIIPPPTITVTVWGMPGMQFVLNHGQASLAQAFGTSQQNVSRYLDKGMLAQVKIKDGTYTEKDIWGFSPTDKRREANRMPPVPVEEASDA